MGMRAILNNEQLMLARDAQEFAVHVRRTHGQMNGKMARVAGS